MSLNYIKKNIKLLISDINARLNKIDDSDLNYKELTELQKYLKHASDIVKGVWNKYDNRV